MGSRMNESLTAYLFLAPFLVLFVVFLGYPVFYSLSMSLGKVTLTTDWYRIFDDMAYCGLDNYVRLFTRDREFWWSLGLTLAYAALTIPLGIALSLTLAMLLSNKVKGVTFFRASFFLPNVLDPLVVGLLWVFICAPEYGLLEVSIRTVMRTLGLPVAMGGSIFGAGLLSNSWTVLPTIALAMVLKGAGFGMILFLTAIQNIPVDLYEAADLDGASSWDKLVHITIPFVKPIILFMAISGLMGSLNCFTEIYAMAGGEGGPATQVPVPGGWNMVRIAVHVMLFIGLGLAGGRWVASRLVAAGRAGLAVVTPAAVVALATLLGVLTLPPLSSSGSAFTARAASVSGFYLYKTFERGDYGYAATIAVVLMGVALTVSVINMKFIGTED